VQVEAVVVVEVEGEVVVGVVPFLLAFE